MILLSRSWMLSASLYRSLAGFFLAFLFWRAVAQMFSWREVENSASSFPYMEKLKFLLGPIMKALVAAGSGVANTSSLNRRHEDQ